MIIPLVKQNSKPADFICFPVCVSLCIFLKKAGYMNRENYELLSASLLKDMAKKRGIRGLSAMRKSQVVYALVVYDRQK